MIELKHSYNNEQGKRIIEGRIYKERFFVPVDNGQNYGKAFVVTVNKQGLLVDVTGNLTSIELTTIQKDADRTVRMSEQGYMGFRQTF